MHIDANAIADVWALMLRRKKGPLPASELQERSLVAINDGVFEKPAFVEGQVGQDSGKLTFRLKICQS